MSVAQTVALASQYLDDDDTVMSPCIAPATVTIAAALLYAE